MKIQSAIRRVEHNSIFSGGWVDEVLEGRVSSLLGFFISPSAIFFYRLTGKK